MKAWVKLYTEILDDRKMSFLTDRQYRVFINLLALAGIIDDAGRLLANEDLAYRLRMRESDLDCDLEALNDLDMVQLDGNVWTITHWSERQPVMPSETPEATRERKRQQRLRDKDKDVTTCHDVTNCVTGVTTIEENRVDEKRIEENVRVAPRKSPDSNALVTRNVTPGKTNGHDTTEQQAFFGAICDAIGWDCNTITTEQRANVGKAVAALRKGSYTPEDIIRFRDWWFKNDWRGKDHKYPLLSQLRSDIKHSLPVPPEKPYASATY
jgi:hypothetical protein